MVWPACASAPRPAWLGDTGTCSRPGYNRFGIVVERIKGIERGLIRLAVLSVWLCRRHGLKPCGGKSCGSGRWLHGRLLLLCPRGQHIGMALQLGCQMAFPALGIPALALRGQVGLFEQDHDPGLVQHRPRRQVVIQHHIAALQQPHGAQGQKLGVSRS